MYPRKNLMKKLLWSLVACWSLLQVQAAEKEWMTDVPKAQAKAKEENKLVFMNFTGSDWCIWCVRLKNEVFTKPEFKEYAEKNLVLVELDFPRKTRLSPDLAKANEALLRKYKIEGFPTIVIVDGEGKKIGELGYVAGGPTAFLAELEKLKKKG
jgi:thioredoxin-related protein